MLISASVWVVHNHLASVTSLAADNTRGMRLAAFTPLLAIGVGLFVLAWVERYPALAWLTVGYLVVAAVLTASRWPSDPLSQLIGHHPLLFAASRYLTIGGFLLLGSASFALTERSRP